MQTGNTSIFVLRPCLLKAGKFEMDYQNVSNWICQKTSTIKETLEIPADKWSYIFNNQYMDITINS